MTSADDCTPVPDSAMGTGSDDGEPGGRLDQGPLRDDERALLERLADGGGEDVVTAADEDSPAAARAADAGTVLPGEPVPTGDAGGDAPRFEAP